MNGIKMQEIHPYVRHARTCSISGNTHRFKNVAAYDYRLLLVSKGSGTIMIDQKAYSAEKGFLFVFPPGTPYSYCPVESNKLTLIAISFDLSFLNISSVQNIFF